MVAPAQMDTTPISTSDRIWLQLQRMVGWATFAIVGPGSVFTMRVINNNRIEGVDEARKVYRDALASGRPTLICANHLTMVDSAYLHWALAPLWQYLVHFERFSWNVAAIEHFTRNLFLKTLVFLGKTVPIDRGGDEAHRKAVLNKIRWLVQHGEVCTLFPEGTRSRTGRIDPANVTYGIGQILKDLERPQVLCAYLRGSRQEKESGVPARGDTLKLKVEVLEPTTTEQGLRASRDLSRQVIAKLKTMEDEYLAQRGTGFVVNP
jgi:1-acyl-sn-glycerol-3-phosphate acyltransferase